MAEQPPEDWPEVIAPDAVPGQVGREVPVTRWPAGPVIGRARVVRQDAEGIEVEIELTETGQHVLDLAEEQEQARVTRLRARSPWRFED